MFLDSFGPALPLVKFISHTGGCCLDAVAPKGTILWEDYDEFLAQIETEIDAEGFHETCLARFAAFDLQFLLTDHRYYVYSEDLDAVSPAELCCHTLLIDDGSRHRSYCLLLLSHVDVEAAREQMIDVADPGTS